MISQYWSLGQNISSQPETCPLTFLKVSFDGEKLLILINYSGSISSFLVPCLLFKKCWSHQGHDDCLQFSTLKSIIHLESFLRTEWGRVKVGGFPHDSQSCQHNVLEVVPVPTELQWGFCGIKCCIAMNTRSCCLMQQHE